MEIKLQFFIVYILADILIIIGWFVPYLYILAAGIDTYTWIWGLYYYNGSFFMLTLSGDILMMFILAIIIIVLVIIDLIAFLMLRKKGDIKIMGILNAIMGIIILIFVIVPIFGLIILSGFTPFIGFYFMLIGAIIAILSTILAFRE
ncbi:MAG: hypothetical protein JSV62_11075 [Promethearchaeota archaeon]|nr:MAG: hypothetical protein JSV62_11075 [Candidatus Lokiarchaeota archaeon]